MKSQSKKQKAFVLPSTIFTIVFISFLMTLIFSLGTTQTLQNNLLKTQTKSNILSEEIFFNFKNGIIQDYENVKIQEYVCTTDENIRAVLAQKNQKILCFGIYDFGELPDGKHTICFQKSNFDYELKDDDTLVFFDLTFSPQN